MGKAVMLAAAVVAGLVAAVLVFRRLRSRCAP